MTYPHPIRLRGPWNWQTLAPPTQQGRLHAPGDWGHALGRDFRGTVRFSRSFQPPARLDPHERLFLVAAGLDAQGRIAVNGAPLGEVAGYPLPGEFDITHLLQAANTIHIDVSLDAEQPGSPTTPRPGREHAPGGLIRDIVLEVRSTAWVSAATAWAEPGRATPAGAGQPPRVCIQGEVSPLPTAEHWQLALRVNGQHAWTQPASHGAFTIELPIAAGLTWWNRARAPACAVDLELSRQGEPVWNGSWNLALPGDQPRRQQPLVPWPACDWFPTPRAPQPDLQWLAADDAVYLAEEILAAEVYAACDEQGVALLQAVPPHWLPPLAPLLAHHPCIIGWTPWPLHSRPPVAAHAPPAFGRPWLPANTQTAGWHC